MNVEELYWKLKELRDKGHARMDVMVYVNYPHEYNGSVDEVVIDEWSGKKRVFLTGEEV